MTGALRAELVRTRGSAALLLTLTGLVFALLSAQFAAAAGTSGSVRDLLNWQSLYATGLAAPIMTLIAGAVADRELSAREGGALWRVMPRHQIVLARVLVLIGLSGIFHVLSYGVIAIVAMAYRVPGSLDVLLTAGVVGWVSSWAWCTAGLLLAELLGSIPAVLVALVLQVTGTLPAEHPWWWAVPTTWPVRPSLWALMVHQNAVPLAPDEPRLITEPWTALALCVGAAIASTLALVLLDRRGPNRGRSRRRSTEGPARRRSVRGGALGSAHLALHGTSLGRLTRAAVALLALVASTHRRGAVAGVFSYGVLPIGAVILPVVAWSALRGAWRVTALHGTTPRMALLMRLALHVLAMTAVAALAVLVEGTPADLPRRACLWGLTGCILAFVSLATAIRFGAATAVGTGLLWWIFSVTFAGDVLAATPLWLVSLPLWAECAHTPARLAVAVPICLLLLAVLPVAIRRSERRFLAGA